MGEWDWASGGIGLVRGKSLGESELLDTFDVDDAAIVDGDMDGAEAKGSGLGSDDLDPVDLGLAGRGLRRLPPWCLRVFAHC